MVVLVLCALNLNAVWSIGDHIRDEMRREDPASLAFTIDVWVFPPLVWQIEIAEEMRALLETSDATELIIIQYTLPYENHYHLR